MSNLKYYPMKLIDFSFTDVNGKNDTLFINREFVVLIQLDPINKDKTGIGFVGGNTIVVNHPIGEVLTKLGYETEKRTARRIS